MSTVNAHTNKLWCGMVWCVVSGDIPFPFLQTARQRMVVTSSSTVILYLGNGLAFLSSTSLDGAVPTARSTATSSLTGRFKTSPTAWTDEGNII